jgi:hypothetical protein
MADRKHPGDPPAETVPEDAVAGRDAQDHERAGAEARGQGRPKEQQGLADAEPQDKPTARDARGNKQRGYAAKGKAKGKESEETPPLGK